MHLALIYLIVRLEVSRYPDMMPSKMSCMPSFKIMSMLYGESGGTPLCQEFHYKLICT